MDMIIKRYTINQRVIASKIIPLRIIIFSQEKQITFTKKLYVKWVRKRRAQGMKKGGNHSTQGKKTGYVFTVNKY